MFWQPRGYHGRGNESLSSNLSPLEQKESRYWDWELTGAEHTHTHTHARSDTSTEHEVNSSVCFKLGLFVVYTVLHNINLQRDWRWINNVLKSSTVRSVKRSQPFHCCLGSTATQLAVVWNWHEFITYILDFFKESLSVCLSVCYFAISGTVAVICFTLGRSVGSVKLAQFGHWIWIHFEWIANTALCSSWGVASVLWLDGSIAGLTSSVMGKQT